MPTLSEKQLRFVAEYVVDLNATQAAIRAGYSENTAKQQGSRLLTNVDVQAAIAAKQHRVANKLEITAERVREELAKAAFANMLDFMKIDGSTPTLDFSALTREQAAAISELTVDTYVEGRGEDAETVKRVRFKLHDKLGALNQLAKLMGMEKMPGDSADNPLHVAVTDEKRLAAIAVMAARAARAGNAGGNTGA